MTHTNEVKLVENGGWDERILVCRNAPLVDTFIVVTARYVVVVDTMINEATGEALWRLAAPFINEHRSLVVVNTHADYDHAWGNQVFAALGAPIIGRRLSVPIFEQESSYKMLQAFREQEPEIFGQVRPQPPTIQFDESLTLDGGDLTLQLFATPGHTVDHASIYIPQIRTLLAADAAEAPYPVARTPAGLPQMRHSLARLAVLDADTVLYCHAPMFQDNRLLKANMQYFDRLEAACRDALARRDIPRRPPEDLSASELIDAVGLPYEAAVPDEPRWPQVHEYFRTVGHAEQLRHMLAALEEGG